MFFIKRYNVFQKVVAQPKILIHDSAMRCYLLAIRCLRSRCCLIIIVIGFTLIISRIYQTRRTFLFHTVFRRGSSEYEYLKSLANLNSSQTKHFIPGQFLKDLIVQNKSFCTFKYGLPDSLDIPEEDIEFTPELGPRSHYRVVYNVISPPDSSEINKNNITYCTHATPEFFFYVVEVLRRWEGPVSIAAFVPNTDISIVICLVKKLCSCLPDMARVSLHFVYPNNYPPELLPCPAAFYSSNSCALPKALARKEMQTFRNIEGLTYPINVARNAARLKTDTAFILVSDVELFPSKNLIPNFIKMLDGLQSKSGMGFESFVNKLVYVVPVFEVHASEQVPEVKSKLLELYSQNQAFYFHRWVCSHCQRFPGLQRWVLKRKPPMDDSVQPFFVVRREFPFHRWEPVFIGTNAEPLYSEMLTWEGQQDKMTQMHEMCLLRYRFVILDGAFMVHAPGVKKKGDITRDSWRSFQQKENNLHYDHIINKITAQQKTNSRCKVH